MLMIFSSETLPQGIQESSIIFSNIAEKAAAYRL